MNHQEAARAAKERLTKLDRPMAEWDATDYTLKETLLLAELKWQAVGFAGTTPRQYTFERQILDLVEQLGDLYASWDAYELTLRDD